eukprot:gene12865-biopygen8896
MWNSLDGKVGTLQGRLRACFDGSGSSAAVAWRMPKEMMAKDPEEPLIEARMLVMIEELWWFRAEGSSRAPAV